MFTTQCFIRKNTPELINKLIDLGYVKALFDEEYTKSETYGLIVDQGDIAPLEHGIQEMELMFTYNFIDCDDNEDLFIALAALRDDTDVNQWFVMDVEEYMNINQGDWFIATDRTKGKHIGTQIDPMYCHKATVEEIIEHFNKK
jgi:hypothetical protein